MLHERLISVLVQSYPSICEAGGTPPGHLNIEKLDGAVSAAAMRLEMHGLSSDAASFAAYALWFIARDHPASDGNKRLALAAAQFVLGAFGFEFDVTRKRDVQALVIAVAGGSVPIEEVASKVADLIDWS